MLAVPLDHVIEIEFRLRTARRKIGDILRDLIERTLAIDTEIGSGLMRRSASMHRCFCEGQIDIFGKWDTFFSSRTI
jgi:hypothetical protein